MGNMIEKLKHWFDCYVRNIHIYDLGYDYGRWKKEAERQCKTVGYVDCYCMFCGKKLMRNVVGNDNGKSE
jgi:hypothetical protein